MRKPPRFSEKVKFWVVFDTCTRPEYYQDLHNLLALPHGAVIRYEYRNKYFTDEALHAAQNPDTAPCDVVLMYTQAQKFCRGQGVDYKPTKDDSILILPTRIARMRLTPSLSHDEFCLDLEVRGYPELDEQVIQSLWQRLAEAGSTPWNKWVAISSDRKSFEQLDTGSDANWAKIVDKLGSPPFQFADDSFWRVKPAVAGSKGLQVPVDYELQRVYDSDAIRAIQARYRLSEGSCVELPVETRSPLRPNAAADAERNRFLHIDVEPNGALELLSASEINLRQYTEHFVTLGAKRSEYIDERQGICRLHSEKTKDGWPTGPSLKLICTIRKRWASTIFASLSFLGGLVGATVGPKVWDTSPGLAIAITCVGGIAALVGTLMLNGKITVKL